MANGMVAVVYGVVAVVKGRFHVVIGKAVCMVIPMVVVDILVSNADGIMVCGVCFEEPMGSVLVVMVKVLGTILLIQYFVEDPPPCWHLQGVLSYRC